MVHISTPKPTIIIVPGELPMRKNGDAELEETAPKGKPTESAIASPEGDHVAWDYRPITEYSKETMGNTLMDLTTHTETLDQPTSQSNRTIRYTPNQKAYYKSSTMANSTQHYTQTLPKSLSSSNSPTQALPPSPPLTKLSSPVQTLALTVTATKPTSTNSSFNPIKTTVNSL